MKTIKLIVLIVAIGLFSMACDQQQPQQVTSVDPYTNSTNMPLAEASPVEDDGEYWAKDNFDLQRVGNVLERSNSPQEFETYLNEAGGVNNLDLNGDGYV